MWTRITLIIALLLLMQLPALKLAAQQDPLYTQYIFNPFVINPAIAGTNNYYQIRSNHRLQWLDWAGAPVTNNLSIYGPLAKQPMGIGGYISNDVMDAVSVTGAYGSYAYNYPITTDIKASGGLTVGVIQYKMDGTRLKYNDESEAASYQIPNSKFVPDANMGIYIYSAMFQGGISVSHLLNNKLNLGEATGLSKLRSHFSIMGGYKYYVNRDIAVEPSTIIKMVNSAPPQMDLLVRGIYQDMVWMGVNFRTSMQFQY
ncbi:MAG: type IX secretion system membrane protein PorP/SprF [Bacteroidales bacterium]|nr:type IX secretion system membrane protein PorP/SprF [Bacteroidales bacterium]